MSTDWLHDSDSEVHKEELFLSCISDEQTAIGKLSHGADSRELVIDHAGCALKSNLAQVGCEFAGETAEQQRNRNDAESSRHVHLKRAC